MVTASEHRWLRSTLMSCRHRLMLYNDTPIGTVWRCPACGQLSAVVDEDAQEETR